MTTQNQVVLDKTKYMKRFIITRKLIIGVFVSTIAGKNSTLSMVSLNSPEIRLNANSQFHKSVGWWVCGCVLLPRIFQVFV